MDISTVLPPFKNASMSTPLLTNDTNVNGTQFENHSGNPTLHIIAAIFCLLTLVIGIIGNGLVLIVFGSRWSRLKSFEIYMISLAAADLIATVTYPSMSLHDNLGGNFSHVGIPGCTGLLFMSASSVTISTCTLVVISVDRYVAVKWPLREGRSNTTMLYVVGITWLIGFSLGSMYLVEGRVVLSSYQCRLNFTTEDAHKTFVAILFITQSGIPLLCITVLYSLIIYELNKSTILNVLQNREHLLRKRLQRNKKATQLLIAIVAFYCISITPERTFYLIYTFKPEFIDTDLLEPIYAILAMIFMTNSCVNPIIYAKLHTSFRRQTLQMFCSCCSVQYKSFRWISVRDSVQTLVSTSVRRASIRFSRDSDSVFLSEHRRPRSRSATASFSKRRSSSIEVPQRTFSGPPCAVGREPKNIFLKELCSGVKSNLVEATETAKTPRLSVLIECNVKVSVQDESVALPLLEHKQGRAASNGRHPISQSFT